MNISERKQGNVVFLELEGVFDFKNRDVFRRALDSARRKEYCRIVLNLERVTFMDSTGMGLLVMAYQDAKRTKRQLGLLRPMAQVKKTLEYCAIQTLIPIYNSETEAAAEAEAVFAQAMS